MAGFLSVLKRIYLTIYNWTIFVAWFQVLYMDLMTLKESGHEHEKRLLLAQTAAIMEILRRSRKLGKISNYNNFATDRIKIICNLGNFVDFS